MLVGMAWPAHIFAALLLSLVALITAKLIGVQSSYDGLLRVTSVAVGTTIIINTFNQLVHLEFPLLIGTSKKSAIGTVLGSQVGERLFGTAATVAHAICAGIDVVRIHDGSEMRDVVTMSDAIVRQRGSVG